MRVKELIGKLFAMDHEAEVRVQTLDGEEELQTASMELDEDTGRPYVKLSFNPDLEDNNG